MKGTVVDKSTNREINVWINGRELGNSFKGILNAMRKARNQLANMTIGIIDSRNAETFSIP